MTAPTRLHARAPARARDPRSTPGRLADGSLHTTAHAFGLRSTPARLADRLLHTTAQPTPPVSPDGAAFHWSIPVVDLVVGTALMRPTFEQADGHGHVDLARLQRGGVDLVGLTIATRAPGGRGLLSAPFLWSQGLPARANRSDRAIAEWLIDRVESWAAGSGDRLRLVRRDVDLEGVGRESGVVHAFLGVQGGQVLEGDPANLSWLAERGVRLFAPAHLFDNELVGSSTGVRSGGLSGLGREVIAECGRLGVIVDLAHMSRIGVRQALPLLDRPFVLSHTGFTSLAGRGSRWRRFSPGSRNLDDDLARDVAEAGGVIGVTLSTQLLGGDDLAAVGRAFDHALAIAGPGRVALGSDMDGALRMVVDAAGLPAVTAELLRLGHSRETVAAVMGGNALRVLCGPPGSEAANRDLAAMRHLVAMSDMASFRMT